MDEWKPIKTAPKGGHIIEIKGIEGTERAWWSDWQCWMDETGTYCSNDNPTHWRYPS